MLEGGGGGGAPKKKGGGGKKPPVQGPPVYNTYTTSGGYGGRSGGGGRSKSLPTPQGPPTYSSQVVREIAGRVANPNRFDPSRVQEAQETYNSTFEQPPPNFSSFTEPEARVVTEFSERTPEEAARVPDINKGLRDTGDGTKTIDDVLNERKTELVDALRERRSAAIRSNVQGPRAPGRPAPGVGKVEQMTYEEYQALDPKARAAVDFNTMLVQAVRRDAKMRDSYDPTEQEEKTYERTVEKMFGPDRGSDLYSPETVALLRQVDVQDKNADLDDFLGLNAAITEKDITHLKTVPGPTRYEGTAGPLQLERLQLTEELATKTAQMQQALAKGQALLSTVNLTARADRQAQLDQLGGMATNDLGAKQLGYGPVKYTELGNPKDLNSFFILRFDTLASTENDKEFQQRINDVRSDLSASEFQAFMNYANNRTSQAEDYGSRVGVSTEAPYVDVEKTRKRFGFDKGGK